MAESSVTIQHEVDPATGKLITTVTKTICATPVYQDVPQLRLGAAMFNVPREKDKLVIKVGGKEKVVVKTMRLSCQSDTYQKGHRYGGVVIYLYNGKSDWRTANNTHALSGYIIIQDTDSKNVKQWRSEPGQVHGAVYRNAFGESVNNAKVVGEGFAFREKFEMVSGVFNNPSGSEFHDSRKRMNEASVHCLRKIVTDYWKYGGSSYIGHTFKIKDLLWDFKD
ncbi:Hypothetical predicted protein [Paramuricea clavata]|uniref:Uncharacterized protein n=1 Tax=Paramuricea clavata TaxID=317549 RepID=A0A7D9L597_PARCT|nr:Hypothetical predicted protein [Paramuricea clavata]